MASGGEGRWVATPQILSPVSRYRCNGEPETRLGGSLELWRPHSSRPGPKRELRKLLSTGSQQEKPAAGPADCSPR